MSFDCEELGMHLTAQNEGGQMRVLKKVQFLFHLRVENVIIYKSNSECFINLSSYLVRWLRGAPFSQGCAVSGFSIEARPRGTLWGIVWGDQRVSFQQSQNQCP